MNSRNEAYSSANSLFQHLEPVLPFKGGLPGRPTVAIRSAWPPSWQRLVTIVCACAVVTDTLVRDLSLNLSHLQSKRVRVVNVDNRNA